MKFCPRCKVSLDESQFYSDASKRGGLAVYCQECCKETACKQRGHAYLPTPVMGEFKETVRQSLIANRRRQERIARYGLAVVEAEESLAGVEE